MDISNQRDRISPTSKVYETGTRIGPYTRHLSSESTVIRAGSEGGPRWIGCAGITMSLRGFLEVH